MKGFKVLEANYRESEKKLATCEETVHAACFAYTELVSEAQATIRDREEVRDHPGWENPPSIFDRKLESFVGTWVKPNRYDTKPRRRTSVEFPQEITTLREEMETNRKSLFDREEVRHNLCGDHLWR